MGESSQNEAHLQGESDIPAERLLRMFSRHQPTPDQLALAPALGYSGILQIDHVFGRGPVSEMAALGILPPAEIAVVAPGRVVLALVKAGFSVIEFENSPSARREGTFACTGAYRLTLDSITNIPAGEASKPETSP